MELQRIIRQGVTKIDEAGTLSIRYNITEEGGRTMELNASIEREDRNLGSVSAFPDGRISITEEGGRTIELNDSIEREVRNLGSASAFPDGRISFYIDKGSNLSDAEKKAVFAAIVDEAASAFRSMGGGTPEKKAKA